MILEPVRCDEATKISCGRIIVRTEDGATVYDTDGNIVFENPYITDYQDDVAVLRSSNVRRYVDLQGNDLFEEYDFSAVVVKEIPSN